MGLQVDTSDAEDIDMNNNLKNYIDPQSGGPYGEKESNLGLNTVAFLTEKGYFRHL